LFVQHAMWTMTAPSVASHQSIHSSDTMNVHVVACDSCRSHSSDVGIGATRCASHPCSHWAADAAVRRAGFGRTRAGAARRAASPCATEAGSSSGAAGVAATAHRCPSQSPPSVPPPAPLVTYRPPSANPATSSGSEEPVARRSRSSEMSSWHDESVPSVAASRHASHDQW
jgi:hypothetical protein